MMLVGSLKNISEYFEPPKFLLMLKIFLNLQRIYSVLRSSFRLL